MIYVFGNSHAHTFSNSRVGMSNSWGDYTPYLDLFSLRNNPNLSYSFTFNSPGWSANDNFRTYSLGPVIAYNFLEHHHHKLLEILNNMILKSDDYILLAIGEVDCRWHLPYQAHLQNKNNNDIVSECIERLFKSYLDLKSRGYNVIGWGGHPSTSSSHNDDPQQPVFGDCLNRNNITLLWDEYLSTKCNSNNIPYISIVRDLIDDNGLTKMEYFSDYCHLDYNKIYPLIEKKFRDQNLIN